MSSTLVAAGQTHQAETQVNQLVYLASDNATSQHYLLAEVYLDAELDWSVDALWRQKFTPLRTDQTRWQRSDKPFWMKFTLHNRGVYEQRLILHLKSSAFIEADLYEYQNGSLQDQQKIRLADAIDSRPLYSSQMAFPLRLRPGQTTTYLYRVFSPYRDISKPTIHDDKTYYKQRAPHDGFMYFVYGVSIGLLIYNFILAITSKEQPYFIYTVWVFSYIIFYGASNGSLFFLWPAETLVTLKAVAFFFFASAHALAFSLFTINYLDLKNQTPWMRYSQYAIILLNIAWTAFYLSTGYKYLSTLYSAIIFGACAASLGVVISTVLWAKGSKLAKAYLMSFSGLFAVIFLILIAKMADYHDTDMLHEFFYDSATLLQMLLLSTGLGNRLSVLKVENKNKEAELIAAQNEIIKSYESSEKLKNDFMSTITHELLTPINGIRLSLSLLKPSIKPSHREFFKAANNSNKHMLSLIESMIIFAEAKRGNLELNQDVFNPSELLKNSLNKFKRDSQQLQSTSYSFKSTTNRWIVSDPVKIITITQELLKNAAAFTNAGEISLSCSVSSTATLCISISDTGTGITENMQSQILEAFSQVDSTITRVHGGLGIGLSIACELLALMNGTLEIKSSHGQGSTFSVHIPIQPATQDQIDRQKLSTTASHLDTDDSQTRTFENSKILIVEDNNVNMMLLVRVLKRAKLHPLQAEHGKIALEVLRDNPDIAAVLMDCQMPVMDGFEATRRIRLLKQHSRLPIIAVTANVSKGDQQKCTEAGMNDYLPKPVNAHEITTTLYKWLRLAQAD